MDDRPRVEVILTTVAALVKMLIPHSWVHQGLQIMQWIVAVPDYVGEVTSLGGGTAYGFAGNGETTITRCTACDEQLHPVR